MQNYFVIREERIEHDLPVWTDQSDKVKGNTADLKELDLIELKDAVQMAVCRGKVTAETLILE